MKQLGDITKIKGDEIPPVDVIIGGSPCQDLSIAGRREGLNGERSSLFLEQIRVIKEMRNGRTNANARFMVWENVPGAFSSNGGEDFRRVLEETARVKDENAVIPRPKKWANAGAILGDGWSIAWRVLDAQFWGVPQRRRRISLVADFDGAAAPEILFVRTSMQRDIAESRSTEQGAAGDVEDSINKANGGAVFENHSQDARYTGPLKQAPTVTSAYGTGGNNQPFVVGYDVRFTSENSKETRGNVYKTDTARTIDTGGNNPGRNQGGVAIVYSTSKNNFHLKANEDVTSSLVQCDYKDPPTVCENAYSVRRLTPLECERLQGYPDNWTDIGEWIDSKGKPRQTTDSARYKAIGNSIAIPPWRWVLKRLCACYERPATMGSLFDGIGGFPYIWEQLNGKGTCLWASEIEDFPIAVTELRINKGIV